MKFFSKKLAVLLLSIICVLSLAGVLSGCKSCAGCKKNSRIETDNATTVRKTKPQDGSTPMEHTAIENIGYMAYVLDNQPFYHAYAVNSTKSMGYTQKTSTWKDYKSAANSGIGASVMVASDISYSDLVKSSTQSCFVGGEDAFMRSGNKPSSSSVSTSVEWSKDDPEYYSRNDYLYKYGEFSTEISVYVINEDTISSAEDVVDNGDGTYTQKFHLKKEAVCWYQYGMKTRGSLKDFPDFKWIEISFTFDANWQVLSSYCEEKANIKPGALMGMPMDSTSKTTTEYNYTQEGFDNVHYGYFEDYFKKYVNEKPITKPPVDGTDNEPALLDVLAGGFSQVVSDKGQQFDIAVTLGETEYIGKIYLKLTDLSKVLDTLEVRAALEKKGSGKQDFYAELKSGAVNVYYSDGFAVTANINEVSGAVESITDWVKALTKNPEVPDEGSSGEGTTGGSSLDFQELLAALDFSYTDTSVKISLDAGDLLGTGLGVNAVLNFSRTVDSDGFNSYAFINASLNSITYKNTAVDLKAAINPDGGSNVISHKAAETPLDLADFIGSVYQLLDSPVYKVSLSLDGSADIQYINGLVLDAAAYVKPENAFRNISASVDLSVSYSGISADLNVYYTVDLKSGNYGNVYLTLNKLNQTEVGAKVCCNVSEIIEAVKALISSFGSAEVQTLSDEASPEVNTIASVINKVINLNFGKIIKDLKASQDKFNLTLGVGEILSALEVDLGIDVGDVALELGKDKAGKATLSGELSNLGLSLGLSGSETGVSTPEGEYGDLATYLNYVTELLNSEVYAINVELNGADTKIAYLENVSAKISAYAKLGEDYKSVEVYADQIALSYADEDLITVSVKLSAYYTIGFNGENLGKAYINITDITFGEGETAKSIKNLDIKVTAEISSAIDAVKAIADTFKTNSGNKEKLQTPATTYANVAQYLNYVTIVEQIKTSATALDISLDVDGLLGLLGLSDKLGGMTFGSLALELGKNESGKAQLSASLEKLGLNVGVSGSKQTVSEPTEKEAKAYANVNEYLDGVNNLLNNENIKSYLVSLTLNGTKIVIPASEDGKKDTVIDLTGLTLNAPAQVALEEGFGGAEVFIPLTADYVTDEVSLSVELNAYYKVAFNGIKGGNYGDIYLHLDKVTLNGETTKFDAKVKCHISELVESIETLIGLIKGNSANGVSAQAEETVSGILATVISLDYVSIINQITADGTGINLNVNVDEILENFVDLKGFKLGNLALTLTADKEGVKLNGKLSNLGLSLGLSGSETEVSTPKGEYGDLATYLNYVTELLNSEVYAINVELNGADTKIAYLENVSAKISAYAKLGKDYKSVEVYADQIALSYADEDLITVSVKLSAYYTIGFNGENLGKAYINITDITFGEGETAKSIKNLDIKVTAEISSAIDAVKAIADTFKTNSGNKEKLQTPATTYANVADYLNYVTIVEQIKTSATALDISLDVDGLLGLLGLSDKLGGMTFGSLALELGKNESGKAQLSASLEKLGLALNVSSSKQTVSEPTEEEAKAYANVNEYLDGVNNLLNNENIKSYLVSLTLNGTKIVIPASEEGAKDTVIDLTGLTLNAPAQVALEEGFGGAEVFIPLTAEYVTDEVSLSVELNAYYKVAFNGIKGGNYGDIYLHLDKVTLNGETTKFDAKVKCHISELVESIETLIRLIKGNSANGVSAQAEEGVSEILATVISLDYVSIINQITADGTGINLNVNVDEILENFVDLKGFKLGNLALTLETVPEYKTESEVQMPATVKLSGSLEKLGLSLGLSGSETEVSTPKGEYLNLNEFMDTVLAAYEQATAIIEAQDILFNMDGTLTVDGVAVNVKGNGEVVWDNGGLVSVAVDAVLGITEDNKTSTLAIKFIYDDSVNGDEAPLVKLTVGTLGLNIYRKDIRGTADGAQGFINSLNKLIAMFKGSNSDDSGNADGGNDGNDTDVEESEVQPMNDEGGLDIYAIANAVLGELNKFGITLTGEDDAEEDVLKDILISHANGSLKLSANGALAMDLTISDVLSLKASVCAPEKDGGVYAISAYTNKLNTALGAQKDGKPVYTFYGAGEDGKFVKAVYEYLFDVIESLSIKEILGTDTYTVHLALHGNNSGISALKDVTVIADLYYTEGLNGTAVGTKLVEAELDITIKNTVIRLNARYAGQTVYIELKHIAGTQLIGADSLSGIKLMADVHDIYEVAETLYNLVTGINFPEEEAPEEPDNGDGEGGVATQSDGETPANGEKNAITALLTKILSLNLDGVITREKVEGENVYTIKPDSILEAFDVNVTVGTVTLKVNPVTHNITASALVDGKDGEWLAFNANVLTDLSNRNNTVNVEDYIDIGFVKTLVKDLANTLVDEQGNINTLYSFAGNIEASLTYKYKLGFVTLNITSVIYFENTVLTAGLDENKNFFLTITAGLKDNTVKAEGISIGKITAEGKISLTYSNGLITLGRDGQYKVMTMAYFLDTLKASDSPVKWLLGTDGTLWGIISGQLPTINSGLSNTEDMYLYDIKQATADDGKFYLSSLLSGYQAMIDGEETAYYGTAGKAATEIGVAGGNYYAFDINGNSLTNGTITSLYVALLRNGKDVDNNDVKGISGLKASAGVMGLLSVKVNLDNRATAHAEDYYKVAKAKAEADGKIIDVEHKVVKEGEHAVEIFGCYDTASKTNYYLNKRDKVTVRLLDMDGNVMVDRDGHNAEYQLPYGSKVYLDSVWAPFWSDDNQNYTLTYGDKDGTPLNGTAVVKDGVQVGMYIELTDAILGAPETDEDGNKIYSITLKRIVGTTKRKAITYHTGVDGVGTITAALALNADEKTVKLIDYDIGGYVLLGMYTNESHNSDTLISNKDAFAGDEVYCLYVIDTVMEDGVIYKLHNGNADCNNDVCGNVIHYHVNTYDANAILRYTEEGSTLFIKNVIEVNGVSYPVTAIDEKAFGYMGNSPEATDTTPGIGAGLKNVVVPENIAYVGALAFADNHNIKTAVFLAPNVKFGGYDKEAPFYGSAEVSGGQYTNLNVYYNEATSGGSNGDSGVPAWAMIRAGTDWLGNLVDKRYIGHNGASLGSELSGKNRYEYSINDGNRDYRTGNNVPMWAYVDFSFVGENITNTVNLEDLKIAELTSEVKTSAISVDKIAQYVTDALNAVTSKKGYINAFNVEVSGGVTMTGTRYTVTITVTEKPSNRWYYAFDFSNTVPDCTASYTVAEQNKAELNGVTYVLAGANIALTYAPDADGIYVLDYWELNGEKCENTITSVTMPEKISLLKACWKAQNGVAEVTVISEISFTYHGHTYEDGENNTYTVKAANNTTMGEPEASGYDFLGWATKNGTSLTVQNPVSITEGSNWELYALWVEAKEVKSEDGTVTKYATFTVSDDATVSKASGDGTVYGWYKYDEEGYVTTVSNTLTTSHTVLKARLQYSLTVQVASGGSTQFGYSKNTSGETADPDKASSRTDLTASNGSISGGYVERISNNGTFNSFDTILEGYIVKLYRFWTNAMVITVEDETIIGNNKTIVTYLFKARKTSYKYDWRDTCNSLSEDHYIKFESGGWNPNTDLTNSNGMYYRSDNADGNKHLFGTITGLKANIELYLHS